MGDFAKQAIDAYERQERHIAELKAENAKLRELLGDIANDYLYSCGYSERMHRGFPRHTCAEYDELVRELGIELRI